ncbi:MAG: hypothetical protein KDI33_20365 [Halioglobus sp.]|nr:hypothetical protein [Halioglobus sp.]
MQNNYASRTRASQSACLIIATLFFLTGCNTAPPKDAFQLSPTSLADRQMQSRRFDSLDEKLILSSSVSVLQDLGYALDVSNADLGVLTASKALDATNAGQIAAMVLLVALGSGPSPIDKDQKIRVTLVVNNSLEMKGASVVRITMNRIIWNTHGQITRAETLNEPELYQAFFEKLSKATFLEAHEV